MFIPPPSPTQLRCKFISTSMVYPWLFSLKNYVTNMLLWVKALYVSSLFSFRIIFVKNAYKRPEKLVQHPEAANKKIMTGALFCLQIDSWG